MISGSSNCIASRRSQRTQLDESYWRTWRCLSCYRADHPCFMLRGVYKPAMGCPNLITFGKMTIPNIKACYISTISAHSFIQCALITKQQVTSTSSPLLSSLPNLPLPFHPLQCPFFVKASLDRSSYGDLASLFTPPTNYNQSLNCCLIVFSLLALTSQLYARPRTTRTTSLIMLLLHSTVASTGLRQQAETEGKGTASPHDVC